MGVLFKVHSTYAEMEITLRGGGVIRVENSTRTDFVNICRMLKEESSKDESTSVTKIAELERKVSELEAAIVYAPGGMQAKIAELSFLKNETS